EHVSGPAAVALPVTWGGGVGGAGRGFRVYPELSRGLPLSAVFDALLPRALEIARLAWSEALRGRTCAAELAIPVYLRDDVTRTSRN
ncbi:MAG TPA: hypothetical protein VII70_10050, partial [Steroidobacteraceae bacterium]